MSLKLMNHFDVLQTNLRIQKTVAYFLELSVYCDPQTNTSKIERILCACMCVGVHVCWGCWYGIQGLPQLGTYSNTELHL